MGSIDNRKIVKKKLMGKKENDPIWVKDIASYLKTEKTETYNKHLKKLFLDYTKERLKPMEAWEKAKKVLECFSLKK